MATASVSLTSAHRYSAQLRKLHTSEQLRMFKTAGTKVGAAFDSVVRNELPPPVRRKKVAKYWTAKQRRWWWATMRAKALGKSEALPGWSAEFRTVKSKGTRRTRKVLHLSGSYRRTGTLDRTLAYWIEQDAQGTTIHYGTNRAYAKWVIDKENQSKYHQGNWPTLQALAYQQRAAMNDVFAASLDQDLAAYWKEF